eukprot:scaffold2799_cov408-Prasinococcus_capsulatus_cf.AAC.25
MVSITQVHSMPGSAGFRTYGGKMPLYSPREPTYEAHWLRSGLHVPPYSGVQYAAGCSAAENPYPEGKPQRVRHGT